MQRIAHGFAPDTANAVNSNNNNLAGPQAAFLAPQVAPGTVPFNLMFPDLPDEARLSPTEKTLSDLAELGATMHVEENDTQFSSTPAATLISRNLSTTTSLSVMLQRIGGKRF
jgi:hypothetical protein